MGWHLIAVPIFLREPHSTRPEEVAVDRKLRINYQIRVPQVRLIDEDGTQVGIKSINEALALAQQRGQDLVEIAPQANPPVCKVVNYSKFRYDQEKREREARKKQKTGQLKEVRVRPRIGEHDLEIKLKHAREFLQEHNKVQITVMFMGREMQHRELGMTLIHKIKETLSDVADVEHQPQMMGNRLFLALAPKK
jgi:translation initiation factor IF-3